MTGRHRAMLTRTQLEILEALAAGLTPKEIAGRRGISHHTVRSHIAQARWRTQSATTHQLVARIRTGKSRSAERAFA